MCVFSLQYVYHVSSYCNHSYSTCDICVLLGSTHHCVCYNGSHLCGPCSIRSAWCGSATTIYLKEHNKGFFWPHPCATAATTTVTDVLLGICQLCHGFSSGEFSQRGEPTIHYVLCLCLL